MMVLLYVLLYFVLGFISALVFLAVIDIHDGGLDDGIFPYAGMVVIAWPFLDFVLLVVLSFYLSGRALEYVYKRIRK